MSASFFRPHPATPTLVGMVHLGPLPGSPRYAHDMPGLLAAAEADARALIEGGCDALLVENMNDLPYLRGKVAPETVAAMALAVARVVALGHPTGLQILAAANREALGVAVAAGAAFIRVEAFAYAHVADEGWLDACAGELVRARAHLRAEGVAIWADVQKKHAAHAVTADLDLAELAQGTAFCGADALIVTGAATGRPTDPEAVRAAATAGLPVVVGSGVTVENARDFRGLADALIVGTSIKHGGRWQNPVDVERVRALRRALDAPTR